MAKRYKPRAIETIAQNTLMQYDPELVNGDPREVPIEDIIELHFGIIVGYRNLSKNGRIHGMTVFEDSIVPIYDERTKQYEAILAKEGTILIDKRLHAPSRVTRLRFTLAHELGHYIIHSEYYRETESVASKLSSDSDAKTEREADELGAALLMPYGRVKVAHKRLCGKLSRDATVRHLSTLFGVSVQAMEIRLERLGLLQ